MFALASFRPQMVASAHEGPSPLFRFGIIADVQWADVEDGFNFQRTTRRCYRGALETLRHAVDWWRTSELDFVAQLGDLIDGQNARLGNSDSAMDAAVALLNRLPCKVVNIVGNHELYNFNRVALAQKLEGVSSYHSFIPARGWRIIALDAYRESLMGWPEDDPRRRSALLTLTANNPNIDPVDPEKSGDWFKGLPAQKRRFVPYNGGFGKEQLGWLQKELTEAAANGERVIILSHDILAPEACDGTTMALDYDMALAAIKHSGALVVMVLCGHDHKGGYHLSRDGVHHLTLCSPLNKGADGKAYGLIEVHEDRIELRGPALRDLLPFEKGRTGEVKDMPEIGLSHPRGSEIMRFPLRAGGVPRGGQALQASVARAKERLS